MEIACAVQFIFFCGGKHESGNGSCKGWPCHYPALRDVHTKHTVKRKLYRIVCSPDRRCILWEAKLIPGASVRAAELFSSVSEIM
jgi:hypothetical protein